MQVCPLWEIPEVESCQACLEQNTQRVYLAYLATSSGLSGHHLISPTLNDLNQLLNGIASGNGQAKTSETLRVTGILAY